MSAVAKALQLLEAVDTPEANALDVLFKEAYNRGGLALHITEGLAEHVAESYVVMKAVSMGSSALLTDELARAVADHNALPNPQRPALSVLEEAIKFLWDAWSDHEGEGQPRDAVFGPGPEADAWFTEMGDPIPRRAPPDVQAVIRKALGATAAEPGR